jgi:hypothetical protein
MPPAREPIGDPFTGVVLGVGERRAIALAPQAGADTLASGTFVLRYAVEYLGKPHLAIVPDLIALDYGQMLTGEDAWDFLLKRSNLYPRADVFGYRNDGKDEMVTVKMLDLAQPITVLVYADAPTPIAQPTAAIAAPDADLPPRVRAYLPCYATLADWQARYG